MHVTAEGQEVPLGVLDQTLGLEGNRSYWLSTGEGTRVVEQDLPVDVHYQYNYECCPGHNGPGRYWYVRCLICQQWLDVPDELGHKPEHSAVDESEKPPIALIAARHLIGEHLDTGSILALITTID